MKIEESQITKTRVTGLENLDPICVFFEDFGPGQGKLTVQCFDKAWTYYWSHMGDQHTIRSFLATCDDHYVAMKLKTADLQDQVTDWDAVSKAVGEEINEDSWHYCRDELAEHYGDEWYMMLPQMENYQFTYLRRIVRAVQDVARAQLAAPSEPTENETQPKSQENSDGN